MRERERERKIQLIWQRRMEQQNISTLKKYYKTDGSHQFHGEQLKLRLKKLFKNKYELDTKKGIEQKQFIFLLHLRINCSFRKKMF